METRESNKELNVDRLSVLDGLKMYTLSEIQPIIGVTHRTLMTYVYDGKLNATKIGGKWRVREDDLKKFLKGE